MKINPEDHHVIIAMRQMGCKWSAIAANFGVTNSYMREIGSGLMKEATIGRDINVSDFGKSRLIYMSLAGTRDDTVKLSASKALVELSVDDRDSTVATVVVDIKADILKELS